MLQNAVSDIYHILLNAEAGLLVHGNEFLDILVGHRRGGSLARHVSVYWGYQSLA